MSAFTHMSLGFLQEGNCGEVFKVVALLQKKVATVNYICECRCVVQGNCKIFVGQMVDCSFAPMMVILNKGTQSELKLGTANIAYDPHGQSGEFKFWFFENQVTYSPFMGKQTASHVSVDIYVEQAMYLRSDLRYATGNSNVDHVCPERQGWDLMYSDQAPATIRELTLTPEEAVMDPNLQDKLLASQKPKPPPHLANRLTLGSRLQSATNQITQAVNQVKTTANSLPIRPTRAQLIKEQRAQEIKNGTVSTLNGGKPIPLGYSGPSQI